MSSEDHHDDVPESEVGEAESSPASEVPGSEVESGIRSGTGSAVESGVGSSAGSAVPSGTGSQVTSRTGSFAIESGVDSKSSKTGSTTGSKTGSFTGEGGKRKNREKGPVELANAKIGFVGAGKIAESMIKGLLKVANLNAKNICVSAPSTRNLEKIKELGVHVTKRNYDIFGRYDCDIIFLCFHGNVIRNLHKMGGTRPHPLTVNYIPNMRHPIYIMSMVSGISLTDIKNCLLNPEHPEKYMLEMHRMMISTSCAYGMGLCAVDCEPDSKKLAPVVRDLLGSISKVEYIPESQMDAACALGGSGLAYAYYYLGNLADGGVKMGLAKNTAIKYACKTAQSAALCLLESGKHPSELKDETTAPSGAAIYGVHVLDRHDCQSGISSAIEAAHKRALELANS